MGSEGCLYASCSVVGWSHQYVPSKEFSPFGIKQWRRWIQSNSRPSLISWVVFFVMFRWMKSSTWISTSSRPRCPFRLKCLDTSVLLHVMHHLVEVTLALLFQAVFGLAYILFLASSAGDAVDEVVAVARHFVFRAIFSTCGGGHYLAFRVQQGTVSTLPVGTGFVDQSGRFTLLRDGGFDLTSRSCRFFGLQ